MFLQVSVILFTGGGVSQHALQVTGGGGVFQHALQVSRPTPKGSLRGLARGVSRPTLGGSPGPNWGGSPGPHPGEGCIPACTEANPPANSYCYGRYASYWNAFLLLPAKIKENVNGCPRLLPKEITESNIRLNHI